MDRELTQGDKAPKFETQDIFGSPISITNYQQQPLMLCFFRYAGCPWCNLAIHYLIKAYPKLKKENLEVIAFFQSSKENILKNIVDRHTPQPPFSLVSDPQLKIYSQYGVQADKKKVITSIRKVPHWIDSSIIKGFSQSNIDGDVFLVPAQFIISSRDQKIDIIKYWSDYYDPLSLIDVYEYLIFEQN